jgi:flagellin-like hook-associated protein FlgL
MMQLLELLRGTELNDPTSGGLIGAMNGSMSDVQKEAFAKNFLKLYDAAVNTTMYNGEKLLGTAGGLSKTFQLGDGAGTLTVQLADFTATGMGTTLKSTIEATTFNSEDVLGAAQELQTAIATALGGLGGHQSIVAMNQRLLDSRLTNVAAAEGRISNADIAIESSRMARAELLAQNAMSSIMYTRNYAAFAVSSLFR